MDPGGVNISRVRPVYIEDPNLGRADFRLAPSQYERRRYFVTTSLIGWAQT